MKGLRAARLTALDVYNDNREHADYIFWLQTVFFYLYSKLRNGARVCINIGERMCIFEPVTI